MVERIAYELKVMRRNVEIDFGRLNIAVTKHGLDGAQVGAVLQKMGREAMP